MSIKIVNLFPILFSILLATVLLLPLACIQIIKPIYISFPSTIFDETASITNKTTNITLTFNNWKAICNNNIQWEATRNNPRVALGFFSSLAQSTDLSIQLVEYSNGALDIVKHDANHSDGEIIQTLKWANPLTISLISDTLSISSPEESYETNFPSFRLVHITGGSTQSDTCSGGKVDVQVESVP